jgi:hypothetical protein
MKTRNTKKPQEVFFRVPMNYEGEMFLELAKKFLNTRSYRLVKKARASGRKVRGGNQAYVPLRNAEWVGVYFNAKVLVDSAYFSGTRETRVGYNDAARRYNR